MKLKYYSSDLTLSDIAQYPEAYVEEVKFETLKDVEARKYFYDPKPEVFEWKNIQ